MSAVTGVVTLADRSLAVYHTEHPALFTTQLAWRSMSHCYRLVYCCWLASREQLSFSYLQCFVIVYCVSLGSDTFFWQFSFWFENFSHYTSIHSALEALWLCAI